jgi:hypothetical protein
MDPTRYSPNTAAKPVARAVAWDRTTPEPYAQMQLSPAARAGLMGLRLFLGLITAMALFTFVHGLHG